MHKTIKPTVKKIDWASFAPLCMGPGVAWSNQILKRPFRRREMRAYIAEPFPASTGDFKGMANMTSARRYLRRKDAASYLQGNFGFGAERSLAKGVVTGDTPNTTRPVGFLYTSRRARRLGRWRRSARRGAARRRLLDRGALKNPEGRSAARDTAGGLQNRGLPGSQTCIVALSIPAQGAGDCADWPIGYLERTRSAFRQSSTGMTWFLDDALEGSAEAPRQLGEECAVFPENRDDPAISRSAGDCSAVAALTPGDLRAALSEMKRAGLQFDEPITRATATRAPKDGGSRQRAICFVAARTRRSGR